MDLADALIDAPAARPDRLAMARERLEPQARVRSPAWPALGAAALAATAAVGAAAAVILCAPSLGAPSGAVFVPVRHIATP